MKTLSQKCLTYLLMVNTIFCENAKISAYDIDASEDHTGTV